MTKTIYQNKILYPEILWERPLNYYQASGGRVLVVAGSQGSTPQAILSCEAVFRSGTGTLTLAFPDKIKSEMAEVIPTSMALALASTYGGSLSYKAKKDVLEESKSVNSVIIGPGISENSETIHLAWELIFEVNKPVIVAGDGVSTVIKGIEVMRKTESEQFVIDFFKKRHQPLIFVLKESQIAKFSKLTGLPAKSSEISTVLGIWILEVSESLGMTTPDGDSIITTMQAQDSTEIILEVLPGIAASFVAQNPQSITKALATSCFLVSQSLKSDEKASPAKILGNLKTVIKETENH